MARMMKTTSKKNPFYNGNHKTKNTDVIFLKEKSAAKREMLQHLIHPNYILFDWEFFSNQLEFE